jgi:hypothetical protein
MLETKQKLFSKKIAPTDPFQTALVGLVWFGFDFKSQPNQTAYLFNLVVRINFNLKTEPNREHP